MYRITDNYIAFWFKYIYPYRSYLEKGEDEYVVRKIKEGFILRKCANSEIVVPVGENMVKYKNVMITLSGSARLLWDELVKGCDEKALVAKLLEEYDVSEEIASRDVALFVEKLRQAALLDD